ncbi:hypothetical protein GJ496_007204 [Pomphorhynchus laevis]|nr:hypothetical protein GJ496_007203 [Pomphorhynchus laevis]KAI0984696.1 hypothetical protein GJ496_007204 [Pomphorhynchus laevis]
MHLTDLCNIPFALNTAAKLPHIEELDIIDWDDATITERIAILKDMILSTEIWSVLLSTLLQDTVFALTRYLHFAFQSESIDKLIFFLMKNIFMVIINCGQLLKEYNAYWDRRIEAQQKDTWYD